jgi:hypothetical protein
MGALHRNTTNEPSRYLKAHKPVAVLYSFGDFRSSISIESSRSGLFSSLVFGRVRAISSLRPGVCVPEDVGFDEIASENRFRNF